jgi:hypothetical protein
MRMRRPTPIFRDEMAAHVARMRTFLGLLESVEPRTFDDAALQRAGFSTAPRPEPDPFLGRRIVNEVMERDRQRRIRRGEVTRESE